MKLRRILTDFTTRKPEKSNGITDGIFPSVIYTDGNNSVSKSVGIYRQNKSIGDTVGIYRRNISVGIYRRCRRRSIQFIWNIRNGMVTSSDFTDGNYRGIQTEIVVQWRGESLTEAPMESPTEVIRRWCRRKKPLYAPICRHSLPLFLLLLLSHPTSPLPNCSQTLIPNSPLFSTRALKFLISCTWSQYSFLVDFIIFL